MTEIEFTKMGHIYSETRSMSKSIKRCRDNNLVDLSQKSLAASPPSKGDLLHVLEWTCFADWVSLPEWQSLVGFREQSGQFDYESDARTPRSQGPQEAFPDSERFVPQDRRPRAGRGRRDS